MKIYTKCKYCKADNSIWTWYKDRGELKMNTGDSIHLTCKSCGKNSISRIDNFEARKNSFSFFLVLIVFLIGTPLLFMNLWDFFFKTNYIYAIVGLISPIAIPGIVLGIMARNDQKRVSAFNRS